MIYAPSRKPQKFYRSVWLNLICLVLASNISAAHADDKPSLTMFAAASMTDAMDKLSAVFEQSHGIKIIPIYASSSALARQIEYGAPVDLFVSASVAWMDYLEERALIISSSRFNLAGNSLILVMKAECPASLDLTDKAGFISTLKGKRLALGEPTSVPAGIYAAQALTSLSVYDTLLPQMAFSENVRMVVTWVERRAVDIGIVYTSDLHAVTGINHCATFPQDSHDPILYPIAHIKRPEKDQSTKDVHAFLDFLTSTPATEVLQDYGFNLPEPASPHPSTPRP